MSYEIATILGDDGYSSTLTKGGTVRVYRRFQGEWSLNRQITFIPDEADNLSRLRQKIGDIINFLGECKIFVTYSAGGALYFELMKAGISVWEVSGKPEDFLDQVLEGEEKERITQSINRQSGIPGPFEREKGEFFISIKDIQGKTPGITSKQILQEFIQAGQFRSLEIECDHIPPWIEMEGESRKFSIESEKKGQNDMTLRVINPQYL